MRFKMTVEYDGTDFVGWQRQSNGPSVQAAIEDALTDMHGGIATAIRGAGRTDAGVHAFGQVAHFDAPPTTRAPMRDRYVWHLRRPIDVGRMQEAANLLVGRHDFNAFRAADCERKTTTRTVSRLAVARSAELVTIEVEADAFLKNMVRILVGTLCEVGWGKRPPADVQRILDGRDRRQAGITAPAQGLALVRVDY